jgi:predicted nucleotidyltransferase
MQGKTHAKLPKKDRSAVVDSVKRTLDKRHEISFVYLHGSFGKKSDFRDIDIAVYLKDAPASPLEYEIALETEIMHAVAGYPADVRVLNNAPLSFRYHVIKEGLPLIVRNDDTRSDFLEATLTQYFDFAPFRALYLKETLGIGA